VRLCPKAANGGICRGPPITPTDATIGRYREPVEGTQFGRYQLIELLGRGGMGEVWRAHDTTIDRVVALKMLLPHYAQDPDFDKRFRREARTAARLDDPHVVPIYDVGEIDGRLYVTMRLINGVDLDTLLKTGPLKPERAVHIIEQIASALHTAHRAGLVHRDVKPSNILLADNDFAYLIDFGIARAADDTALTSEGSTIGTWAYMAPERFRAGDIEPSSDIYALACVLYQCLTGEPPFPGSTLEQVAVGHMVAPPPRPSETSNTVPRGLDRVIETGLAKHATDRYPTAVEMAAAARHAITEPTSQPHAVPTQLAPVSHRGPSLPASPDPAQAPSGHAPYGMSPSAPAQFSAANLQLPPAPAIPKRQGRRHGVLVGAVVFIVTLIVAGGVAAVVGLAQRDNSASTAQTPAAGGADFNGTYRADYGPGTDLEDKPVPNAPATTSSWAVRSTCGASGCAATAANISDGGIALLSNLTFDQLGGTWVAVGLASAQCGGDTPAELWVVYTLQPHPTAHSPAKPPGPPRTAPAPPNEP
jgi:serine/threonine protein kinase